ncbi:hypothetical protein DFJ74DRAFT_660056 [Hyaloraphidium curvatum]|nr:hypothetical protein DFJ74DRAFT_660056 [Hyaloraphidium curvatum]
MWPKVPLMLFSRLSYLVWRLMFSASRRSILASFSRTAASPSRTLALSPSFSLLRSPFWMWRLAAICWVSPSCSASSFDRHSSSPSLRRACALPVSSLPSPTRNRARPPRSRLAAPAGAAARSTPLGRRRGGRPSGAGPLQTAR